MDTEHWRVVLTYVTTFLALGVIGTIASGTAPYYGVAVTPAWRDPQLGVVALAANAFAQYVAYRILMPEALRLIRRLW